MTGKKILIIFASSRSNGNTKAALNSVIKNRESAVEVLDLLDKNITPYDYGHKNQNDDFLGIAEKMTKSDVVIFVTPVYWYSMSAQLKTFFDRFTDLITIRKDLGRALKDRICYVISSGADKDLPEGFEAPFSATAKYLDMSYGGCLYCHVLKDGCLTDISAKRAQDFAEKLFN